MSAVPTFYHSPLGDLPGTVRLSGAEADHVRALRLEEGDRIQVTDGEGGLWRGRLVAAGSSQVTARLERPVSGPPTLPAELAFGVARKSRTLWLVEKAVELGAASLQPVECRRSRSVADAGRSEAFWGKARRRMRAALKQCGGGRLPRLRPVRSLTEYIQGRKDWSGPALLLGPAAGTSVWEGLRGWEGRNPARLLVGPEGGFTEDEVAAVASGGWRPASLGPRTLRFETAALAGLAVVGQATARDAHGGEGEDP